MGAKWRPERDYDKAIHEELAQATGCEYVSGSLRELIMVDEFFQGTEPVTVYLLDLGEEPSKVCDNPGAQEKAWNVTTNEVIWIDTAVCHELRGSGYVGLEDSRPRRYRRLTRFIDCIWRRTMFQFTDERDFIERYCFRKMRWNGREIEHIYFNNKDSRKVFLQYKPDELRDV